MNKILKILNPLLFISAATQVTTVFMLLILNRDEVLPLHRLNGEILLLLIILHFILNFGWVKANYFSWNKPSKK